MAYVKFFDALGHGGYIQSGNVPAGAYNVFGTPVMSSDNNDTYSQYDADTVLVTGSYNNGEFYFAAYVDDIGYTNIYEIDSAYLYDSAINDLVWMYDINLQFDIRDDFSHGIDLYNMYAGNDTFIGNRYGDYIEAGKGNDLVKGDSGKDILKGQGGKDTLKGQAGKDTLNGGTDNDTLKGGSGDDLIRGGAGRDKEYGGKGEDTFVFNTGDDKAIIQDFDAKGKTHDLIDLSGLASVRSWNDLTNNHMEKDGSDIRIDAGDGDVIVLHDVTLHSLDKGDFLF